MNTKNLTVLALVGVVVLTGALIVAVSGPGKKNAAMQKDESTMAQQPSVPAGPTDGTVSGDQTQASVQVMSDNVNTAVQVK